jgi:hypothetical protein
MFGGRNCSGRSSLVQICATIQLKLSIISLVQICATIQLELSIISLVQICATIQLELSIISLVQICVTIQLELSIISLVQICATIQLELSIISLVQICATIQLELSIITRDLWRTTLIPTANFSEDFGFPPTVPFHHRYRFSSILPSTHPSKCTQISRYSEVTSKF